MEKKFTNKEVSQLLSNISAAYQVLGMNQFQIRAYDLAADSIANVTSEVKDLWEEGKLGEIPGIGKNIVAYLDELFKTGKVRHFEEISQKVPEKMFVLLRVPGIGPKTAFKLAGSGVTDISDLEKKIKSGYLLKKGFGQKTLANILRGIEEYKRKSDRILLPVAGEIAKQIIEYLKKHKDVLEADPLGSLRRKVATVGDIDISVASEKAKSVVGHFIKFPSLNRIIEVGNSTATISLSSGIRVDLMVHPPQHYGSLLQHFTGSKSHNIHIRSLAREKGYSISEYGVKSLKSNKLISCKNENEVYSLLGMQTPPPELREDTGEIESALKDKLPNLTQLSDIKGDLHTHSLWSDGHNTIAEMANAAAELGREYIALTDHSYPNLRFDERIKQIEQYNYSVRNIRVIYGLEVNINADETMQVDDSILEKHEIIFASIHTSFRQNREEITKRIITAIRNPHVDVISHPTGRLLLEREEIDADWEEIFKEAAKHNKILEINSFPTRLDLPDILVREAKRFRVKFVIDTDSHDVEHLKLMEYGVDVARRGWLEGKEVINTLPWSKFKKVFNLKN